MLCFILNPLILSLSLFFLIGIIPFWFHLHDGENALRRRGERTANTRASGTRKFATKHFVTSHNNCIAWDNYAVCHEATVNKRERNVLVTQTDYFLKTLFSLPHLPFFNLHKCSLKKSAIVQKGGID